MMTTVELSRRATTACAPCCPPSKHARCQPFCKCWPERRSHGRRGQANAGQIRRSLYFFQGRGGHKASQIISATSNLCTCPRCVTPSPWRPRRPSIAARTSSVTGGWTPTAMPRAVTQAPPTWEPPAQHSVSAIGYQGQRTRWRCSCSSTRGARHSSRRRRQGTWTRCWNR